MYNKYVYLVIPNTDKHLIVGDKVKLGRFSSEKWIVCFGWYSWGGNRPVCGWYLTDEQDIKVVKPLQLNDLIDIYVIEGGNSH